MVLGENDAVQKRSLFIQPLMFYPGKPVMEVGSADFPNARLAMSSQLTKALYGIDGWIAFTTIKFSVCLGFPNLFCLFNVSLLLCEE